MRMLLVGAILLLIAGLAAYKFLPSRGSADAPKPQTPAAQDAAAPRGMPVETAAVVQGSLRDSVTVVGALAANETVVIRPEIAGRVEAIALKEGQPVASGALLVQLDAAINRAELAQAEANEERARRLRDSGGKLVEQGYISATEMDRLETELKVAEAARRLAQARLAKTRIHAPFAGELGLRQVSVGDYVTPGQALVNLDDIGSLKVDFRVPETYLGMLSVGQIVELEVDSFPDQRFAGEVYALDPQVSAADHSVALRARVPNPDGRLRPGLFARVSLLLAERAKALLIPEQAVLPQGDGVFVYRVQEGVARLVEVTLGQRRPGQVEVLSGLQADDIVVTAGQLKISDGAAVTVLAPPAAARPADE